MFIIFSVVILCENTHGQQKGTFTDPRDKHVYKWIQIGKQAWMTDNLNYQTPEGSWTYKNDSSNGVNFGRLYDWNTALKACPKGWHLPTDIEWGKLIVTLGGDDLAGKNLKDLDSINGNPTSNSPGNIKNFSTLLGGIRHNDGTFIGLNSWGGFWSASLNNTDANNYLFVHGSKSIGKSSNDKGSAFSVRCIRNK